MMLIVKEEKPSEREVVEMDEYVPFCAEFGEYESSLLYWRGGDGKLSLVEFGLTKYGEIRSITLTSISSENVIQTDRSLSSNLRETNGLPVFDTAGWPINFSDYSDNFQDEFDAEIKLLIGSDYLSLIFVKTDEPVRFVKNQKVRFGIAPNGELATVDILGLSKEQITIVKSAI